MVLGQLDFYLWKNGFGPHVTPYKILTQNRSKSYISTAYMALRRNTGVILHDFGLDNCLLDMISKAQGTILYVNYTPI